MNYLKMATYKEIFDSQIKKFEGLKQARNQRVEDLESAGLTFIEKKRAEEQIRNTFLMKTAELRRDPNYKQAQEKRYAYHNAKRIYETNEQNEENDELQSDFNKICNNLKSFAISMQEEGESLIHKMLSEGVPTTQINGTFYRKGQDILTYFKNFCSGWSNNIHEEKEKNNSIIIEQLGLKETFNNIYRRCIKLSDKYKDLRIKGIEYFDSMVNLFKNIESTIKYYKDNGSDEEEEEKDNLFS